MNAHHILNLDLATGLYHARQVKKIEGRSHKNHRSHGTKHASRSALASCFLSSQLAKSACACAALLSSGADCAC
ncbi:MAG: hypothetical protein FWC28_06790 [Proteobacteria bacterium]|nr:hypothetical protein [Cystobacterineae bacterium]MCL2314936.1 hypothetical protein [Pseudomonadota bacterium]